MKTVYTAARSGYGNSKDRSHTYGELSTEGFLTMVDNLPSQNRLNSHSVLYDLGSGVGKFVFGAALMYKVKRAVGIEIVSSRHAMAVVSKEDCIKKGICDSQVQESVEFMEGDALDSSTYGLVATHLYAANLCFSQDMNLRLAQEMKNMGPQFSCLMVLVKLPQAILAASNACL